MSTRLALQHPLHFSHAPSRWNINSSKGGSTGFIEDVKQILLAKQRRGDSVGFVGRADDGDRSTSAATCDLLSAAVKMESRDGSLGRGYRQPGQSSAESISSGLLIIFGVHAVHLREDLVEHTVATAVGARFDTNPQSDVAAVTT